VPPGALIEINAASPSSAKNGSSTEDRAMSKSPGWAATAAGLLATAAWAAAPVAVVEDVQGKVAGVEFMDYVAAGKVIALGAKDSIVLGYLKSCWRESIAGGTVTVGDEQSTVQGGKVQRSKVACDAGRMQLGTREATQSAATVFRSLRQDGQPAPTAPVLIYGRSPIVEVGAQRGWLRIERIDAAAEPAEIAIEGKALVAGRFVDLAGAGVVLAPGATYAARLGAMSVEFKVDWDAAPGATPIAGRLLRLE
jgi:hypothetical protein